MKKYIYLISILISYLSLNYIPTISNFASSIGTFFILLFSFLIWKNDFLKKIGLESTKRNIIFSLLFLFLTLFMTFFSLKFLINVEIYLLYPSSLYHDFFYTLNEEIILGSLLLFSLKNWLKIKSVFISIIVATIFSTLHIVFYKYFVQEEQLLITTFMSLFLIGIIRNNLILISNSIFYSWAFHFGASSIIFGCCIYYDMSNKCLEEVERLNIFLGNYLIMSFLFIFSLITTYKLVKIKK